MKKNRKLTGRTLLSAVALWTLTGVSGQARAQTAVEFHLPEQDLADTLRAIGRLSHREVIFPSDAVQGRRAPKIDGALSAEEAVKRALAGTDLVVALEDGAFLIRGRSQASATEIKESREGDILVTGTRIRGADSASPTRVFDRSQIENTGVNDLGSFVRTLPQNFSGGQNPGVAGGGAEGLNNQNTNSSSTLNLRGLGPDATLTLVNGHRVAYDGVFQGVDIAAIPVAAIDRLEIVTDGASALYGSDAVGGVANIILRRDFDGLQTSARLGASTDGGNFQQQYNAVSGGVWRGGGVMVAADYSRATEVAASDRSYTQVLDPSATLVPRQTQYSLVLAGHQRLTDWVEFTIDSQFNDRASATKNPFTATADVFTDGLYARPDVTFYAVTPGLHFSLPASWEASLSGTHARSRTSILTDIYRGSSLSTRSRLIYDNFFDSIEASVEGKLFSLPGGDVRLAAGAGYRSLGLGVHITQTAGGVTQTTADTSDGRDIAFAYGELSVPLVGSANESPFLYRLSLSGAVRYESYRGVANLATPKLGLIYAPTPDIKIKGSWGRSFKAQTLYQEYQVRTGYLFPGYFFPGVDENRTVLYLTGGNSELKPEKATTWTVSFDLEPRIVPGFKLEVSLFKIRFTDRVVSPLTDVFNAFLDPTNASIISLNPSASTLAATLARLPQGLINEADGPYDPTQVAAILDGTLQNAARQTVRGIDIAAEYAIPLPGDAKLSLTGSGSYIESNQQLDAAKPIEELAGTIFNPPHWRGRLGAAYVRSSFDVSGYLTYIGGTRDDRYDPAPRVGSFTSVDLVGRLRQIAPEGPLHGVEVSLSLLNLLNQKPSHIQNSIATDPPYDSTNYPVAGRVISLTLTKTW